MDRKDDVGVAADHEVILRLQQEIYDHRISGANASFLNDRDGVVPFEFVFKMPESRKVRPLSIEKKIRDLELRLSELERELFRAREDPKAHDALLLEAVRKNTPPKYRPTAEEWMRAALAEMKTMKARRQLDSSSSKMMYFGLNEQ